jgi:hypothetical protein
VEELCFCLQPEVFVAVTNSLFNGKIKNAKLALIWQPMLFRLKWSAGGGHRG